MKIRIWLLVAALTVGNCSSARAEEEPKLTMHRQGVTVKNETGWYPAISTEGRYSVLMPLPFSDYTIAAKKMDGSDLLMHFISARTTDGVKFSVSGASWDSPKPDLSRLYEDFRKPGQTLSVPLYSEAKGTYVQTFEVSGEKSGAFIRHVITPTELFSFVVEFPPGMRDTVEPLARRFFDSLNPGQPNKTPQTTTGSSAPDRV